MELLLFLSPIFLATLGILILNGKGYSLIAGVRSNKEELESKYKEKELAKFMGRLLLYLACIQFFPVSAEILDLVYIKEILIASNIATIFITVSSIIYINTSEHFRK